MKLVLVYFGRKLPNYAIRNMKLLQGMFPDMQKTIILDTEKNTKIATKLGFESELISIRSSAFADIGVYHDLAFRDGFWFTSLYRLIALCDYAIKENKPIIHMENDILLVPNFPFEAISKCSKPIWFQFNEQRDVAAIIYLPCQNAATWLKTEIIKKIKTNPAHTDMTVLREIARDNQERVDYFPVAESATSEIFRSDVSASTRIKNSEGFEKFNGIFDSAPIGMYFLGRDPRNHRGKLLRYLQLRESFVSAEKTNFNFDHKRMRLKINRVELPIFNLHVHSKLRRVFETNGLNQFFTEERVISQGIKSDLRVGILAELSISFVRRHKLRSVFRLVHEIKRKFRVK